MPRLAPTLSRIAPSPVLVAAAAGATTERRLAPGTVVGGYRIERPLGEGGMAFVYEAAHRVLPRRVAIKVMRDPLLGEPVRARMLREACVLAEVRHRAVVEVHDAGVLPDGRAWIAMNLVEGITLGDRLQQRGTLVAAEVAALITELADALLTAHAAGVVHRDLKPANILLVDDRRCPVRLIDWGIAQAGRQRDVRYTIDGLISGTPHYMAPEQARGEHVDGRCDVYALGIVAYELLAGAPPFDVGNAFEILALHLTAEPVPVQARSPATPTWLAELVMRMLRKAPAARPTMAEVGAELERQRLRRRDTPVDAREGLDEVIELVHRRRPRVTPTVQVVIELVAELPGDELDDELDTVIADLPEPAMRRRFPLGSTPYDG